MPEGRWSSNDAPTVSDHIIVVRRGTMQVFLTLTENFKERVVLDRRIGDRRTERRPIARERRVAERRGPPASTWINHGFLLAFRAGPAQSLDPSNTEAQVS